MAGTSGTGGAAGSSGTAGTGGPPTLSQAGKTIYDPLTTYRSWLSTVADNAAKLTADRTLADSMITWQMRHGGFYKNDKSVYAAPLEEPCPPPGGAR